MSVCTNAVAEEFQCSVQSSSCKKYH